MTKKVLIVVICLVTVCAVLGLNDRLNYEGLQYALGMVTGDATLVKEDLVYFEVLAFVAERYGETDDGRFRVTPDYITTEDGGTHILRISYVNTNGVGTTRSFEVGSAETADKLVNMLKGFDYALPNNLNDGFFAEVIDTANTILHFFGFIYSVVVFVVQMVFDVFGVAFSVVQASFYLLGF